MENVTLGLLVKNKVLVESSSVSKDENIYAENGFDYVVHSDYLVTYNEDRINYFIFNKFGNVVLGIDDGNGGYSAWVNGLDSAIDANIEVYVRVKSF